MQITKKTKSLSSSLYYCLRTGMPILTSVTDRGTGSALLLASVKPSASIEIPLLNEVDLEETSRIGGRTFLRNSFAYGGSYGGCATFEILGSALGPVDLHGSISQTAICRCRLQLMSQS